MDNLKTVARQAKQRLRTEFWKKYKSDMDGAQAEAEKCGRNVNRVKSNMLNKVKTVIRGETQDDFYLKVKALLDEYGEVSDAIGRLTDKAYYDTLGYEEKGRYTMELSARYVAALEKYRREKEGT